MLAPTHSRLLVLTILLIGLGAGVPFIGYWLMVGRAASVSPAEARRLLDQKQAILVCVEPPQDARLLPGEAAVWPIQQILLARNVKDVPEALQGRRLLLVCPAGIRSAQAQRHLAAIGVAESLSVSGGLQEFIAAVPGLPAGMTLRQRPDLVASVPAFRASPLSEQIAIVVTFFGVKLVYSVGAMAIIYALRKRREADLSALRWSMIAFFIGEGFCLINVLVYQDHSLLLEHLHSVGMVLSLALAAYAILEAADRRALRYSDAGRCALAGLCGGCAKQTDAPCGLLRLARWVLPMLALTAALPLFSSYRETAYNTLIFGALHSYRQPIADQIYELRYLPIAAITLLLGSLAVVLPIQRPDSQRLPAAKVLLCAGLGAMAFSFFRLILVAAFVDNQVWFASWEEVTELIFVAAAGGVLIVFRRRLLGPSELEGHLA